MNAIDWILGAGVLVVFLGAFFYPLRSRKCCRRRIIVRSNRTGKILIAADCDNLAHLSELAGDPKGTIVLEVPVE